MLSNINNFIQFDKELEKDIDNMRSMDYFYKEDKLYNIFNSYYKDDLLNLVKALNDREGGDGMLTTNYNNKEDMIKKLTFYYLT